MKVTLFSKPDCHLCEAARLELEHIGSTRALQIEVVDITTDAVLLNKYGERIPVLQVGWREYAAPLTQQVIQRALRESTA
jgi:glutaredoxin